MRSYAEVEIFSPEEIEIHKRATQLVGYLPTKLFGEESIRCHELSRAVCRQLRHEASNWTIEIQKLCIVMNVMDGYYGMIDHSFILLGELYEGGFGPMPHVLDVYAPGRMPQVQLVDTSSVLPFYYRRGAARADVRHDRVDRICECFRP